MTFEGLMQGFRVSGTGSHLAMALAGALLALTAGLTALAFVRAIGITFLGMPRRDRRTPPDTRLRSASLGILAFSSLAVGVAAPWVVEVLERGTTGIGGEAAMGRIAQPGWLIEPGYPDFASISPTVLAIVLVSSSLGFWVVRALVRARRRGRVVPVWASATEINSRTREQYTAFGYANMTRVIFNVIYRIRPRVEAVGDQRFPERLIVSREAPRIFDPRWLYRPITSAFLWVADRVRSIQAGYLGLYLLYLLLALVIMLLVAPRV
jgi:NADH:ubiquinone oxidoreductase subunit 5 (subunit L)/multisubunit Na+/H+ antiporter MnhA subunit